MAARLEEHRRGLEEVAHRDPLTELPNHRRFQEAFAGQLDRARAERAPVLRGAARHRRLQAHQRGPRPSVRRRAARARRREARRGHARPRLGGAHGRGRVRDRAAGRRRRAGVRAGRGGPDGRRAVRAGARRAQLLGRSRVLSRRREERRRSAAARRRSAGLGEGKRPRARPPLQPRARLRRDRGAARGLRGADRAPGRSCGPPSSRSWRSRAASRWATKRWRASTASRA